MSVCHPYLDQTGSLHTDNGIIKIDLVWRSISDGFAQVTNTWWENEEVLDLCNGFARVSAYKQDYQPRTSFVDSSV